MRIWLKLKDGRFVHGMKCGGVWSTWVADKVETGFFPRLRSDAPKAFRIKAEEYGELM